MRVVYPGDNCLPDAHPGGNCLPVLVVYPEHVKLLGVTIDYELNFVKHISEICKKSARQLNVLKRIGRYLNKLDRLTIYAIHLYYPTSIIVL